MTTSSLPARSPTPDRGERMAQGGATTPGFDAAEWDRNLIEAGASLLQSWRWGEFKRSSGWMPLRLGWSGRSSSVVGNGNHLRPDVCAQILFRSVPKLPLPVSVAYIPRGPVYLSGGDDERPFWERVHKLARRRGAIFLKVEPNIGLDDETTKEVIDARMAALGFRPSGRLQPSRTIVLDLSASEDDLLKAMKPKTRYNLRLAGRRGVQVRKAETLEDLKSFYALLELTGQRDEFGIHTLPYYERLWSIFGPDRAAGGNDAALVLLAEHPDLAEREKGPIAGLLAMRFGREAVYMYGASDNRGREHMPNYLLQWEAIRWARESGCLIYDFWGIPDAPTDEEGEGDVSPINARAGLRGVYWFKKGFGGREIEYPGAYDYIYNPLLYKLWMRWRGANLG